MPSFGERLLAAAIFLALEVPLAFIAFRATRRVRPLMLPAVLLVMAVLEPDDSWAGGLLLASLLTMFALAIGARVRKTVAEERRQLAAQGPSPWLGQSRRSSLALIAVGAGAMLAGIAGDGAGPTSNLVAILLFYGGSIMLGIGLSDAIRSWCSTWEGGAPAGSRQSRFAPRSLHMVLQPSASSPMIPGSA